MRKHAHHQPDYTLIILLGILFVFGLIMLSSAGSVVAFQKFDDSYFYFKRQLVFFVVGAIGMYLLSLIDYQIWKKYSKHFYIASATLLLLVFVPGLGTSYGTISKSWVNLGFTSFQPSEFVKLTYLLFLAAWIENRGKGIRDFRYGFLSFLGGLAFLGGLIALQPDIGTLVIFAVIGFSVYFVSQSKWTHLILIVILGVGLIASLAVVSPARFDRLTTFLNPVASDPLGVGYHIKQALIGVGSGGFFGEGLGQSRQKFNYLPEATGDSIFVVIAEELGFFFSSLFVILYLFIAHRLFKIAQSSRDQFGRLFIVGVSVWIIGQAFVNIGAMLGILPLTGLPLPFISYGGSALITAMAAMGIVINVSKYTKQ